MALAREIVALEAKLRQSNETNLFGANDHDILRIPECAALVPRVATTEGASIVRLCLQALRIQHSEFAGQFIDAELVATLPPSVPGLARPTERVVYDMLACAQSEIILLGYEFTDRELIDVLARASSRGTDIIIICDRGRGAAVRIGDVWPSSVNPPRMFQDRKDVLDAPYGSMHAKCLLVDGKDLLITSANFTFHGLHGNIEIGIRVSGAPAAEARKVFSFLVEKQVLEGVPLTSSGNYP